MGKFDDLKRLRDSAAESIKEGDSFSKAIEATRTVADSAAAEAKIVNRKGELSKWRVAKAAARPTKTGRRLVKGALAGASELAGSPSDDAGPASALTAPAAPDAPASWYPDPHDRFEHRYWNGQSWTADVATSGKTSIDPDWTPTTDSDQGYKEAEMGLFSRSPTVPDHPEPLGPLSQDIYGAPQRSPEGSGDRRLRLLGACRRAIDVTDLGDQYMTVLASQADVQAARDAVSPVFAAEPSMLEVIAVRGVFGYLQANRDSLRLLALAHGWKLDDDQMIPEWQLADTEIGPADQGVAESRELTATITATASNQLKIAGAPPHTIRQLIDITTFGPERQLDYIAWTVVAAARTEAIGQIRSVWDAIAPPSALTAPGWYPDPIYADGYRYYDGDDWTLKCWVQDNRGSISEISRELTLTDAR